MQFLVYSVIELRNLYISILIQLDYQQLSLLLVIVSFKISRVNRNKRQASLEVIDIKVEETKKEKEKSIQKQS